MLLIGFGENIENEGGYELASVFTTLLSPEWLLKYYQKRVKTYMGQGSWSYYKSCKFLVYLWKVTVI